MIGKIDVAGSPRGMDSEYLDDCTSIESNSFDSIFDD
jgi:hypothetical protein